MIESVAVAGQPAGVADPLVGLDVAGKYRVLSLIARGSMGKVYRAEQLPLGRVVALKILHPREEHARGRGDSFDERFLLEASTLAKLSHPNTVRIYDFGVWEGRSYLVMEYVSGPTLREVQKGRALEPLRAVWIARQVALSLAEAHQIGVVHRDLKPSNVLLTHVGAELDVVKVVDFGLVKDLTEDEEPTGDGTLLGTPMYMAPEQIRGDVVDARTDVYALGLLLYRALTGSTPFASGPMTSVFTAHLRTAPPPFAETAPALDLPPCVEWTVQRCLEKDPALRFGSAPELLRALRVCEVALEDPARRDVTLHLAAGRCVVPIDLESSWSTSRRVAPMSAEPAPQAILAWPWRALTTWFQAALK